MERMEQNFIQHGDNIITITGNTRCTNADCPYINCVGEIVQVILKIVNIGNKEMMHLSIIRLMVFSVIEKV